MEREIKHRREEEASKILEDKIMEDCVKKARGKANVEINGTSSKTQNTALRQRLNKIQLY